MILQVPLQNYFVGWIVYSITKGIFSWAVNKKNNNHSKPAAADGPKLESEEGNYRSTNTFCPGYGSKIHNSVSIWEYLGFVALANWTIDLKETKKKEVLKAEAGLSKRSSNIPLT